jgi:hypothetical protein
VEQFNFTDVYGCIYNLTHAVQDESTNLGKAILLYADIASQLNLDLPATLTRLMENMERSSEDFIDKAAAANRSHSIADLVEAANKVLDVEHGNQEQLCALVDHLYERAPTHKKRLGYSSPTKQAVNTTSDRMLSSNKK